MGVRLPEEPWMPGPEFRIWCEQPPAAREGGREVGCTGRQPRRTSGGWRQGRLQRSGWFVAVNRILYKPGLMGVAVVQPDGRWQKVGQRPIWYIFSFSVSWYRFGWGLFIYLFSLFFKIHCTFINRTSNVPEWGSRLVFIPCEGAKKGHKDLSLMYN